MKVFSLSSAVVSSFVTNESETVGSIRAGGGGEELLQSGERAVPDPAYHQRPYRFAGAGAERAAVCQEYQGGKPFRGREGSLPVREADH